MRTRWIAQAAGAATVLAASLVVAAPSASADQIWYQGVARASADAPCPSSSAADLTAGWSQWTPSWAQWANGGKGGYVCTRAITWAYEDTGGGGPTCYLANVATDDSDAIWAKPPNWAIPAGSDVDVYSDPACTDFVRVETPPVDVVVAPNGAGQAQSRCEAAFGDDRTAIQPGGIPLGPAIWFCLTDEQLGWFPSP